MADERETERRLIHVPNTDQPGDAQQPSDPRVLASDVEVADSMLARARGLMFRRAVSEDYALVMEMGDGILGRGPAVQGVHMLFVRVPLDVVWLVDEEVTRVARLKPWRGIATARADTIVELPAGAARDVRPGDRVTLQ